MDKLIALGVATLVLVAIPGPNVALIVANTVRWGFRAGAISVIGTTLGVAVQLCIVVLGMATLIEHAADALNWIRWAGVMYLLYLGIRTWREPAADLRQVAPVPAVFWRASLVAAANPKTLLFSAAFLPQFVSAQENPNSELTLLSLVFLTVLLFGDLLWALFAGAAQRLLGRRSMARNKITGAALVLASLGLALSRQR